MAVGIERVDRDAVDDLADRLEAEGGPAMLLDSMAETLEDHDGGDAGGQRLGRPRRRDGAPPRGEVRGRRVRPRLAGERHHARIGGAEVPVGPLELQIAYKLWIQAEKDFEDAAHLYGLFEESLRTDRLEEWVERLDVGAEYDRLRGT